MDELKEKNLMPGRSKAMWWIMSIINIPLAFSSPWIPLLILNGLS